MTTPAEVHTGTKAVGPLGGGQPSTAALPRLISAGLLLALFGMAAVAWAVTDRRMRGMGSDPGTAGFYVVTWVVMMVAMMFPSIWPMVLMHARIQAGLRRQGRAGAGATTVFVVGYLLIWTVWGLAAYGVIEVGRAVAPGSLSWSRGGHELAGAVIVVAGGYQLTSLKEACLSKCRSPIGFLLNGWRSGRFGALRMGVGHGAWCVGCCWGLMAALFALGVMSVGWMVFIAALIAVEKLLPWKTPANRGTALLLVALGLATAFVPAAVPGLSHM